LFLSLPGFDLPPPIRQPMDSNAALNLPAVCWRKKQCQPVRHFFGG